ncbi:DUF5683 domain-containing protein [Parvicella tangerina]|uniref:DUF5683 domain-containing protein n=1 Tax=Parvicella tangerina TaxID=2829795 RepID=A0A916NSY4_9FLAO|nr:DUF5683 domain-containing protein [Parvicella tangerina]CAG5084825.1 hypothetical protein CRYO30217_02576 [Parvicella tangerina]
MRFVVLVVFISLVVTSFGQDAEKDSLKQLKLDSVHKPKISLVASAIFPGMGQIYNQVYKVKGQRNNLWWKLPVIYGGVGTSIYFVYTNQQSYRSFRNERINRLDDNYVSTDYAYLSDSQLKVYQDQYDRWRNLSIIGGLGIYLLQLIDANVEGHLMHFDTSDDLSFRLQPDVLKTGSVSALGLSLRISF